MDWQFFGSLSETDAKVFLENFLSVESLEIKNLIETAQDEGVVADFSIESIAPMFRWGISKIETIRKDPDKSLPEWIRTSSSYLDNHFSFSESSKLIILRLAYYLGETFIRSFPPLMWAVGNRETAEQNMPVITGFKYGIEMAPILVSENMIGRIVADSGKINDINLMIESWKKDVKS